MWWTETPRWSDKITLSSSTVPEDTDTDFRSHDYLSLLPGCEKKLSALICPLIQGVLHAWLFHVTAYDPVCATYPRFAVHDDRRFSSVLISCFCIYKGTCYLPNIGFDILVLYRLVVDKTISSFAFWCSIPPTRFNTDKHRKKSPVSLQTSIYWNLVRELLKGVLMMYEVGAHECPGLPHSVIPIYWVMWQSKPWTTQRKQHWHNNLRVQTARKLSYTC